MLVGTLGTVYSVPDREPGAFCRLLHLILTHFMRQVVFISFSTLLKGFWGSVSVTKGCFVTMKG